QVLRLREEALEALTMLERVNGGDAGPGLRQRLRLQGARPARHCLDHGADAGGVGRKRLLVGLILQGAGSAPRHGKLLAIAMTLGMAQEVIAEVLAGPG